MYIKFYLNCFFSNIGSSVVILVMVFADLIDNGSIRTRMLGLQTF